MSIYEDTVRPLLQAIPHRLPTDEELLDINITVQRALQKLGTVAYSYVTFNLYTDRIDGHVFILPISKDEKDQHVHLYRTLEFTVPIEVVND